jgi:DNA-binding NtrC family response regulator
MPCRGKIKVDWMNKKQRILLIDDEEMFVNTLAERVREFGFVVDISYNAEVALELFGVNDYDLVVTDVHMPGMDGMELILRLRQIKPEQSVVIMTGFPTRAYSEKSFRMGSINYILKPFSSDGFMKMIEQALLDPTHRDSEAESKSEDE